MGNSYLSNAMIPLMMTLVLGYYAARLLIFHDTESITGKKGAKFKDKEKYVTESGKLILFLAVGSFVMAIVMALNSYRTKNRNLETGCKYGEVFSTACG